MNAHRLSTLDVESCFYRRILLQQLMFVQFQVIDAFLLLIVNLARG